MHLTLLYLKIPEDYLIIDPFCGTGAVGEAAIRCGRAYLGADVDKECVDISSTRLSKVAEDLAAGTFPDERRFTQVRDLYMVGDTIHLSAKVRCFIFNHLMISADWRVQAKAAAQKSKHSWSEESPTTKPPAAVFPGTLVEEKGKEPAPQVTELFKSIVFGTPTTPATAAMTSGAPLVRISPTPVQALRS